MKLHILGIAGTFMGGVAALARELGHAGGELGAVGDDDEADHARSRSGSRRVERR